MDVKTGGRQRLFGLMNQVVKSGYRSLEWLIRRIRAIKSTPIRIAIFFPTIISVVSAPTSLAWLIVWLFNCMSRMSSWAASLESVDKLQPASLSQVKEQILSINSVALPFSVREDKKGRLVAQWRIADTKWAGLMEAGGLQYGSEVVMDLNESEHKVRVVDCQRKLSWRGGLGHIAFSMEYFRGINFFQYERAAEYGLLFKDGTLKPAAAYNYRFDLSEMKNPLIDVVLGSGWSWVPVISFIRAIGG